jgi:hypothetical protein
MAGHVDLQDGFYKIQINCGILKISFLLPLRNDWSVWNFVLNSWRVPKSLSSQFFWKGLVLEQKLSKIDRTPLRSKIRRRCSDAGPDV